MKQLVMYNKNKSFQSLMTVIQAGCKKANKLFLCWEHSCNHSLSPYCHNNPLPAINQDYCTGNNHMLLHLMPTCTASKINGHHHLKACKKKSQPRN